MKPVIEFGATVHPTAIVSLGCVISRGAVIGAYCRLEHHVCVPNGVALKNRVFVGSGTIFCNDKHPKIGRPPTDPLTVVESEAVIGANCTILSGVHIGERAVVGAGAVVTKDVPPGTTVVGNPARTIRRGEDHG